MTPEQETAYWRERVDGLQRMVLSLREQLGDAAVRNAETEAHLRQEIDRLTRLGEPPAEGEDGESPEQAIPDSATDSA